MPLEDDLGPPRQVDAVLLPLDALVPPGANHVQGASRPAMGRSHNRRS